MPNFDLISDTDLFLEALAAEAGIPKSLIEPQGRRKLVALFKSLWQGMDESTENRDIAQGVRSILGIREAVGIEGITNALMNLRDLSPETYARFLALPARPFPQGKTEPQEDHKTLDELLGREMRFLDYFVTDGDFTPASRAAAVLKILTYWKGRSELAPPSQATGPALPLEDKLTAPLAAELDSLLANAVGGWGTAVEGPDKAKWRLWALREILAKKPQAPGGADDAPASDRVRRIVRRLLRALSPGLDTSDEQLDAALVLLEQVL